MRTIFYLVVVEGESTFESNAFTKGQIYMSQLIATTLKVHDRKKLL